MGETFNEITQGLDSGTNFAHVLPKKIRAYLQAQGQAEIPAAPDNFRAPTPSPSQERHLSPAPQPRAVEYTYIDAGGNVNLNGRTVAMQSVRNYYLENEMKIESGVKNALTNLFPTGTNQTERSNVELEIRPYLKIIGIV
ncbi:MAG: hypothetical protein V4544_03065 [Pseudomonadota bacterium]